MMKCSHHDVINVTLLKGYELLLTFDDGSSGRVDIAKLVPFEGVFEPLKNKHFFEKVFVNPNIGTICWDNGADISPTYLKEHMR